MVPLIVAGTLQDANEIYSTLSTEEKVLVSGRNEDEVPEIFANSDPAVNRCLKIDDVPVAIFCAWEESDNEVACALMTRSGDQYRHQHYASKVAVSGIHYLRNHTDYHHVYWDVRKDNVASIKIAKDLGFKLEDSFEDGWQMYFLEI